MTFSLSVIVRSACAASMLLVVGCVADDLVKSGPGVGGECVGEGCQEPLPEGWVGEEPGPAPEPEVAEPDGQGIGDPATFEPDNDDGDDDDDDDDDDDGGGDDGGDDGPMCGDERTSFKVYYGTLEPSYLPMTPGQILAIGNFYGCSGTLIAPNWVLSAAHCGLNRSSEICFGSDPSNADTCFQARNIYEPSGDMALMELSEDVTARIPGISPIPLLTEAMDGTWIGRTAEASGYGRMEDGRSNTRKFTAEPIYNLSGDTLTINGEGRHGVCFGDSGGPVMVIASDGTVRIAGVLSNGDNSCVGLDNYTRVDTYRDWIEEYTGPTVVEGAGCGEVTEEGRCIDGRALWCEGDLLQAETCGTCGWDGAASGYRCINGPDPCQGVDGFGACEGQVARWCQGGQVKARDCGACSQSCGLVAEIGAIYCQDDPCGGLDYHGQCNGQVVEYCKNGERLSRDCGAEGLSCGWINDQLGYWCN